MEDFQIQGSAAWHNFRKGKIMASEVATIMGLNPWETAYDLWRRKLGLLPPIEQNEAMLEGHKLEVEARIELGKLLGLKLKPNVIISKEYNWLACSLDAITDDEKVIGEIKAGQKQFEAIKSGQIPGYIYPQLQAQMFVTNLNENNLYAYRDKKNYHHQVVERDDVFISRMLIDCKDFYRRLKEFDPPHPKHRKLENEEMQEAVDTYRLAKDMLARAEKNEQEARSQLLLLSGGECVEGYGLKVTHYTQRGSVDYSAIPELKNVDLDKYRKPPAIRTKIT